MDISILKKAFSFTLEVMGMVLIFFSIVNLFPTSTMKLNQRNSIFLLIMFVVMVIGRYFRIKIDQKKVKEA